MRRGMASSPTSTSALITPSRSFSGCKPSLIPEEGVSYEALEQFSQEHNIKGLSVDQVCELLVKPATLHRKAAYTEIFKGKDPRFVGRANVFVSHAWLCKMTDLLSALRNWLDSLPDEQRVLPWFFWIDVLVCNQEVSGPKDFDWWRKTFKHSVETIGHTVIVMTPWKNPTYIQRAWCLFEFYTTLKCGIPYDITMSAQDQTSFMEELKSGKDVFSHIAQIDIGLAEAKFQTDKDNIMKCMEDLDGGRERVDSLILHSIREWIQKQMVAVLSKMPEQDRVFSNVQISCAHMNYMFFKKSAEAGEMIRESLEARRLKFGEKDERTLYAMKHMACYLQHDNQHIESLRLYETICQVRQKNLEDSKELFVTDQINHGIAMTKAYKYRRDRPDSPRMLIPKNLLYDADNFFTKLLSSDLNTKQRIRCLSEKARVLVLLDRLQEASDMFSESAQLGVLNGLTTNSAVFRMNRDWGDVLTELGLYQEAEQKLRLSYESFKKLVGNSHEETDLARQFLARNLRLQNRENEAKDIERVRSWSKYVNSIGCSSAVKRNRDDSQ